MKGGLKTRAWLLGLIVCVGTKDEMMEQGKRKTKDEELEEEGEWGRSAGEIKKKGEMEREEGRTDGVREGKGKQAWSKRQEEMRGGERGVGRAGC